MGAALLEGRGVGSVALRAADRNTLTSHNLAQRDEPEPFRRDARREWHRPGPTRPDPSRHRSLARRTERKRRSTTQKLRRSENDTAFRPQSLSGTRKRLHSIGAHPNDIVTVTERRHRRFLDRADPPLVRPSALGIAPARTPRNIPRRGRIGPRGPQRPCPMFFVKDHHKRRFCHEGCAHRARQARYYDRTSGSSSRDERMQR